MAIIPGQDIIDGGNDDIDDEIASEYCPSFGGKRQQVCKVINTYRQNNNNALFISLAQCPFAIFCPVTIF